MWRLHVGIDRRLAPSYRPEVCWTWRTLLAGIGFAWQEVEPADPVCDVAYVIDPGATSAKLTVRTNETRWKDPSGARLASVGQTGSVSFPLFEGEAATPAFLRLGGRVVCDRDLIFDVFWLATGQEERRYPKGEHGFFELDAEPVVSRGVLRRALASAIGQALETWLVELGVGKPEPRWPGGSRAAACFGHDVDYPEPVRVLEPLRILARQGASGARNAWDVAVGRRHHWHFGSWMDLEEAAGCRSAFYFVARRGSLVERALGTPDPFYDINQPRFRALFREIQSRGAEIGLHASYRAFEDVGRLSEEKRVLEEAAGAAVIGNRHHYWHLNPNNPEETLRFHERAGFAYDCSLFHDRYIGWRRGFTWPFFPFDQKERRSLATLQLPTGWMDDQLFGLRRHNAGERTVILDELVARVFEQQGCLVVNIHEYVFDSALFPGWVLAYRHVLDALSTRGDVWLATPADIARHWRARVRSAEEASIGLGDRPVAAALTEVDR